jgi:hypothetical protein
LFESVGIHGDHAIVDAGVEARGAGVFAAGTECDMKGQQVFLAGWACAPAGAWRR